MKSLIIVAHPSSKGFSHQIAKKYLEAKGDSEIMNLYDQQWEQPFLRFEDSKIMPPDKKRESIQQKISQAKELIFIFPLWWGFMPAILKNFIDQNFTSGFAFEYKNHKPRGLLTGKTARIFITCDAPKWMYGLFLFPFNRILKTMVLGFCGVQVQSIDIFDKKIGRSDNELLSFLKKVETYAKKS